MEQRRVLDLVRGQALVWAGPGGRPTGAVTRCDGDRAPARTGRLRGQLERRVLGQDRRLHRPQPRARIGAELLGQQRPRPTARRERVGLPTVAVQRQHQQAPPTLAQRVVRDQPLQLGDHVGVQAQSELGLQQPRLRASPHLGEPPALGLRERRVRPIRIRLTTPQLQRRTQLRDRSLRITGRQQGAPARGEITDVQHVDLVAVNGQRVSRTPAHDISPGGAIGSVRLERAPQPHHMGLQRLARSRRWRAVPQRLVQPINAHHTRGAGRKRGKKEAFLRARHGHLLQVIPQDNQLPYQGEEHKPNIGPTGRTHSAIASMPCSADRPHPHAKQSGGRHPPSGNPALTQGFDSTFSANNRLAEHARGRSTVAASELVSASRRLEHRSRADHSDLFRPRGSTRSQWRTGTPACPGHDSSKGGHSQPATDAAPRDNQPAMPS